MTVTESPVIAQTDYYPLGGQMAGYQRISTVSNGYKYNGKEEQTLTGLLDYGFRHYDPALGRWHVKEPFADQMAGISPYAYAYNNPVGYKDLFGLMPSGSEKPFWATSVFDTSADTDEDGFVTPSERYMHETNAHTGAFDFTREQNWIRKRTSKPSNSANFRLEVGGDGTDNELFRIIDGNHVHVFYESYFGQNGGNQDALYDRLIEHVGKHHSDMNSRWGPQWFVDHEERYTSERKPGKTRGNPRKAGPAKIYIHPSAFDHPAKLYIAVGHELIHASHFKSGSFARWYGQYLPSEAEAISEYYAYTSQVVQEERLMYNLGGSTMLEYYKARLPAGFLR